MVTTIIILIIIIAFLAGTYIGAVCNIEGLRGAKEEHDDILIEYGERLERIEADLYGVDFTDEELEIKRIFDKCDG